ncbi:TPA: hypothetical protein N0F65_003360 [Lagenidium giganteum]|uniref:Fatty acid hydroxylase domain-containing protein n=1 Tax=Lagenidium giganteum TaxID=4803 RepID=A0AAV2Z807_9STRA|nr:TPA: hypothetical protein N0F65_003360 [Lagenidium giganteum]
MDVVLELADQYMLDTLYPASWPREDFSRQLLSVSTLTLLGGYALYLVGASLSYVFLFDKRSMKHPRFLQNQVQLEIAYAMKSIPVMMVLNIPFFMAEVRGHSQLYAQVEDFGWMYLAVSVPMFLLFTDMLIYWFHRWLHHRLVYATIHKPHHKWIIPTPFASHAFHPIDGFIQGLPYHLFVLIFPMHRVLFLAMYMAVNFWTISIHDGYHVAHNQWLNGAAHHTVHHEEFVFNYGQYFTLWDRLSGSYKEPSKEPEPSPMKLAKKVN